MIYFMLLLVIALALLFWLRLRRRSAQSTQSATDTSIPNPILEDTPNTPDSPPLVVPTTPILEPPMQTSPPATTQRFSKIAWISLIGLILLCAIGLYLLIGSPQHLTDAKPATPNTSQTPPDTEALVAQLAQHLAEQPDNPQGWFLLGRTYLKLRRYAEAVEAFTALHAQTPEANAKIALADALTLQNQGQIPPRALELLQQALKLAPNSTTTLWLLGQAAKQRNQIAQALDFWQRALPLLDNQPEAQQTLRAQIAQLQPTPSSTQDTATAGLSVHITLDTAWKNKVKAQDTVFIYAKAVQGKPMPLAVSRKTVADLPITVELNDSLAMLPQHTLSQHTQVRVGARISPSGQAIAQAGDLFSQEVTVDRTKSTSVKLVIDQKK